MGQPHVMAALVELAGLALVAGNARALAGPAFHKASRNLWSPLSEEPISVGGQACVLKSRRRGIWHVNARMGSKMLAGAVGVIGRSRRQGCQRCVEIENGGRSMPLNLARQVIERWKNCWLTGHGCPPGDTLHAIIRRRSHKPCNLTEGIGLR